MGRSTRFAVVMAGGAGTRFWPRSRRRHPKQLLPFLGARSLLQETVARARVVAPPARTLVVSTSALVREVRRQLPQLPSANVIGEPVGRNTAACIGLAALRVARIDAEGVMAVLPADHLVGDLDAFRAALGLALDLAADDYLVTIGVPATHPETGYGYIEWGRALAGTRGQAALARSFREKPSRRRAHGFVTSGRYLWNSGMFAWRARRILEEIDRHVPGVGRLLRRLGRDVATSREAAALRSRYPRMPAISIDKGVLERASRVAVVRGRFRWSDVGSWAAMEEMWRDHRSDGNAVQGRAIAVGARGCIVSATDRVVALCGVNDLVVVDAPDAVLVCHKHRAQDVRLLVHEIERRGLIRLL
jgi:mannose-1-phosphate guanylyltransferase